MAGPVIEEDTKMRSGAEYLGVDVITRKEPIEENSRIRTTENARTSNWTELFHYFTQESSLDRVLRYPQLTGIAISGTIGIWLFIMTGEVISLAGSVGAFISYLWASTIVGSFMLCLNEMFSFRFEVGAIFQYPTLFVGPAFGFAVSYIYFLSSIAGVVSLVATADMLLGYEEINIRGEIICGIIFGIFLLNFLGGVRLYGFCEWIFKLCKVFGTISLVVLMIYVNIHNAIRGNFWNQYYLVPPGFNPDGTKLDPVSNKSLSSMEISGGLGQFLGIMTGTNIAIYGFIGVEILAVVVGEAATVHARRDLSRANKWMYIYTIVLYLVSVIAVDTNVGWDDPKLQAWSAAPGSITSQNSPFIIAMMKDPVLSGLGFPQAFKILFFISAITTANTQIYVASRTLFALCSNNRSPFVRRTLGRTSRGNTPLAAIVLSWLPSLLALIAIRNGDGQLVLSIFSRIATVSILCVYAAECFTYICFWNGVKQQRRLKSWEEKGFSYTPRQPYIAAYGFFMCSLFILFNGWYAFYKCGYGGSVKEISLALLASYFGPFLFLLLFVLYKLFNRMPERGQVNFMEMSTNTGQRLDERDEPFWRRYWLW